MSNEPDDIPEKPAVIPKRAVVPRELLFYDNHELVIDKQHRLLLPSDIRRCLAPERDGDAFFIIVGINKKPWLYTENRYFELARDLETDNTPEDDDLAYAQMMFGQATRQPWDAQFRVPVPEKIRRKTGIGTVVTLVGVKDHLELWDREDWAKHEEELDRMRVGVFKRRKSKTKSHPGPLSNSIEPSM